MQVIIRLKHQTNREELDQRIQTTDLLLSQVTEKVQQNKYAIETSLSQLKI